MDNQEPTRATLEILDTSHQPHLSAATFSPPTQGSGETSPVQCPTAIVMEDCTYFSQRSLAVDFKAESMMVRHSMGER